MTDEVGIITAAMFDKAAYDSISGHVEPNDLSIIGGTIWESIAEYYKLDGTAKLCDKEVLLKRVCETLPKQQDAVVGYFQEITSERGTKNVVKELIEVKRQKAGEVLAAKLAGKAKPKEIEPLLNTYQELNDATQLEGEVKLFETSYGELVTETRDPDSLIPLFPQGLNTFLRGGILPGHTVVIIGRVNVGKSALMIYNIAGQIRAGKKVLLIENEDLVEDVKRRIGCCLVGCSLEWAEKNPEQFERLATKYDKGNLLIPDPVPSTVKEVSSLVDRFNPDSCFVNQVRHLAPTKEAASDNTGAVDRVAQQLRAIGKRTRTAMFLVGAAKEGEADREGNIAEKAILGMADSYGSRTGIPGCADVMLGIGTNTFLQQQDKVAISICKNKRQKNRVMPVLYQYLNGETCRFRGT